jgi:uncharacterized protein (TIGR02679 family)
MIHDPDRLQSLLARSELVPLVKRLQNRIRLGRRLDTPLTLSNLTANERTAIESLLARRPSVGHAISIRVEEIERILQEAGLCDSLEEALTHVFGPMANDRRARDERRERWRLVQASVAPAFASLADDHPWLDAQFSTGRLKRITKGDCNRAAKWLHAVAAVLQGIPWPLMSLADLATRLTGDSHALDRDRPLAGLCLSAIASRNPLGSNAFSRRRQLWEWAGVVVDELSAPVLVLNLRADPDTLVGKLLNTLADAGEPCHLSVRLLRSAGASAFNLLSSSTVFACENPSIIAAAAQRLGPYSHPLICTAGQPAAAPQMLIATLRQAGCRIRYHGDFDPAGINIANLLIQRFTVEPWRMSAADFSAALDKGPSLKGACPLALWDGSLSGLLETRGHAVLEESVLEVLMKDLYHS